MHWWEVQVNLIIMLSLGSMETDRVISEPCYNEVIYNRYIIINLGAMTWPCYIETRTIVRRVIMRLNSKINYFSKYGTFVVRNIPSNFLDGA